MGTIEGIIEVWVQWQWRWCCCFTQRLLSSIVWIKTLRYWWQDDASLISTIKTQNLLIPLIGHKKKNPDKDWLLSFVSFCCKNAAKSTVAKRRVSLFDILVALSKTFFEKKRRKMTKRWGENLTVNNLMRVVSPGSVRGLAPTSGWFCCCLTQWTQFCLHTEPDTPTKPTSNWPKMWNKWLGFSVFHRAFLRQVVHHNDQQLHSRWETFLSKATVHFFQN